MSNAVELKLMIEFEMISVRMIGMDVRSQKLVGGGFGFAGRSGVRVSSELEREVDAERGFSGFLDRLLGRVCYACQ